ncbi:antichymotrypsin-2-like isoform X2 [Leguminivora glycinivorella]|uniref:antichymotrypsin-2-like isoform X2 n=1 Tax=Leguminivora glycinivorella TaxID=1035111 RepID=UPI00200EBF17|nr:antichymotrypsin-2-like isoform X2 [Leguminivora glycinivorella]
MKTLIFFAAAVAMASATGEEKLLNDGNNVFTANMFTEVVKEQPGKSMVMSAFSVLQPLAQLAMASVGESHDQILKVIGLPNDNVTKIVFPKVSAQLRAVKGVQLSMANKIYIPTGAEVKEDFAALSKSIFGSEFKNIDFTKNVPAAKEINSWVEDQTNHKIKDLVNADSLGADTRAVLVNALYFKGQWDKKFNEKLTSDQDFHVTKDKTVKVPMMYKKDDFKYAESEELDAKLLELPYKEKEASFLIVLPNEIDGLAALQEKLKDPTALDKAVAQMREVEVNVHLPKFKIESTINLKNVLQKMGVTNLFDASKARLDNLLKNENGLFVSDAIQKAFIEVNEEGAEAAAANAFVSLNRSGKLHFTDPKEFKADHPFLFFLTSHSYELFSGAFINEIN